TAEWTSRSGNASKATGRIAPDGTLTLALAAWTAKGDPMEGALTGRVVDGAIAASGQWRDGVPISGDWKLARGWCPVADRAIPARGVFLRRPPDPGSEGGPHGRRGGIHRRGQHGAADGAQSPDARLLAGRPRRRPREGRGARGARRRRRRVARGRRGRRRPDHRDRRDHRPGGGRRGRR